MHDAIKEAVRYANHEDHEGAGYTLRVDGREYTVHGHYGNFCLCAIDSEVPAFIGVAAVVEVLWS